MTQRTFFIPRIALTLLILTLMGFPLNTFAQQGDNAINENFIFINYIGREMTFDLDDVTYIIPGTDTIPEGGRLALQLPAGEHKFAANIPAVAGRAGEFTIPPGGYVAKAARLDKTPPAIAADGTILAKPKDFVFVFDFDPFTEQVEAVPIVDTWQPAAAASGQGSLVFMNYTRDELTIDIDSQAYKIVPPVNDIPGRFQIDLPPGEYRFTASVPGGGLNNEITLVAGQVVGLNITADLPPEREYEVGEKYDFLLPVTLRLFEEDLTSRTQAASELISPDAASSTDGVPTGLPANNGEISEATPTITPAVAEGLLIKNFAGDTLTFTISNQTYSVADHGELVLSLPPGSYSYTASRPYVAATGTVDLQENQGVELSIAINVTGDILNIYQN